MQLIQADPVITQLNECLELLRSLAMEEHQVARNIEATLDQINTELATAPVYPEDNDEDNDN
jgi:uncharacterized protein (UPF0147 family)